VRDKDNTLRIIYISGNKSELCVSRGGVIENWELKGGDTEGHSEISNFSKFFKKNKALTFK
jgi:hypothetical protein